MASHRRPFARRPRRAFARICAVCGVFGLIVGLAMILALPGTSPLRRAELAFAKTVAGWGAKAEVRQDLVFVGLDDVSANLLESGVLSEEEIAGSAALDLMSFGKPMPREVWALLGERLLEAGARVVVFDLIFSRETPEDDALRAMFDKYPDRVVVGGEFVVAPNARGGGAWAFKSPAETVLQPGGVGDSRLGSVTFFPREDGAVWDATLAWKLDAKAEEEYPSLAARAVEQVGEGELLPDRVDVGIRFPDFAEGNDYAPLPLYTLFFEDTWVRNYAAGDFFKDKIVVVGGASNIEDDRDEVLTAVGTLDGPQLHMAVIANALGDEFFRWAPGGLNLLIVAIAALGAFLVAWFSRRPLVGLLLMLAGVVVYVAGAVLTYNAGLMLAGALPIGVFLLAGGLCFGAQFSAERREKARLRSALDRYVAPEVSDEILARPDAFLEALVGKRKTVTVLFSDLRGFTAKSEHADEQELVAQLNEYLEAMVACVFANGGMVDKFIGDAVMAVWGAVREDGPDADAKGAVAAALEMRAKLVELNEKWEAEGRPTHAFGIGINQGPAVFGNIGSLAKMELTVIGDAVNLASRLEGLTKQYGVDVLISGEVAQRSASAAVLRPIDKVVPKGKTDAVEIFAVAGTDADAVGDDEMEFLKRWKAAHDAWSRADACEAERLLQECARLRPDDCTVRILTERLAACGGDPDKMRDPLRATEK